ncbi:hypothetical protein AAW12_14500 [Sphingobacterium sp. Ag1]|uniref:RHS repeat domain-containing protein n=1 Tax=Sphingobacterium sp. Ag1 TaxID=1643451 RepID=UPI000627CB29|nr:RHS repeat-associated core domain-containing protein [Sphingobacterium sp. Ag1]KKO90752.1 hypothetical protein AAW12_14500 [Sphingobacterium sp. Ag1]
MKRQQGKNHWAARCAALYYALVLFLLCSEVYGQTQIITPEAVVLPQVGQSSYVLSAGQSLTVRSGQSITLKEGVHLMAGSTALFQVDMDFKIPLAPNNPQANTDMNWIINRAFNASGTVVSESKTFYDDLGKQLQQQSKNLEYGHIMARQLLYSIYGKAVGTTLSAPTNNASFAYKSDFFTTNTGAVYSFRNFGRYLDATGGKQDKTESADAVGGTVEGTLGWYYSNANNWEPYQDITTLPYSLGTDASNGNGIFSRVANVGNELRMGKNREDISFSVPITGELELYESIRSKYFTDAQVGGRVAVDSAIRIMSVSLDADRNAGISIAIDGRTVMSALAGTDLTITKSIGVGINSNAYFPVLATQAVTFSGGAANLVDYARNEALSNVSSGASTLNKGLYELRTSTGPQTISYNLGLGTISMNFYDQLGRLRASIPPEGVKKLLNGGLANYATLESIPFVKTFEYNAQGLVIASTGPDHGRSEMKYSTEGRIRFAQNALQKQKGSYSYFNYDQFGRSTQVGEYLPAATGVKFENITQVMQDASGLPSTVGTQSDVSERYYDQANAAHGLAGYVQDTYFLGGAVSYSEKYSKLTDNIKDETKLINRIWYNYDGDGNIAWTVTAVNGLGTKTIDYVYDEFGKITKAIYQKNTASETFVHYYNYDLNGKLKTVYTNTVDDPGTKILQAKYIYALTGELKRVEYGDKLQGVDYVYTIDGKLKSINNANIGTSGANDPGKDGGNNGFATDVFSQNIEYFPNDYSRTSTNINAIQNSAAPARYNGLVNGIGWQSQKPSSITGLDAASMNLYTYDSKGQLLTSTWGTPNYGTKTFAAVTNVNQEKGLTYDNNGNLLSLQRTNNAGVTTASLTYNYQVGTNKLSSVSGYATYGYDAIGQLSSQVKGTAGMYMDYDVTGKVTFIYSDATKSTIMLSFVYDNGGNRIMKKDHRTNAVTWYSYDVSGTLMAVFEGTSGSSLQLTEQPTYGMGRLGMLNRLGNSYSYSLTDHLGNVRAIINRNKASATLAEVLYYADYYPYGMEVRSGGINSRYGYQGLYAEKDKETGWNNFDLRNYDAGIGRWLNVDPKGQHASPFIGMRNNPISTIDPDGGWDYLTASFKRMAAVIAGKNPSEIIKYSSGQYGYSVVSDDLTINAYGGSSKSGNFSTSFANMAANQSKVSQKQSQSWFERAYNSFRDYGVDHPYFHAPSSGQYGPYIPDGIGVSGNVMMGGFTVGLSLVIDEKNNIGLFLSASGQMGYTGVLGAGLTLDLYENNGVGKTVLDGVAGETQDFSFGTGIMGTYSRPIKADGRIDPVGVHKVSLGEGIGAGYGKTTTISLFQTK